MTCRQCEGIAEEFDAGKADADLRRLRRKGPISTTRMLIDDIRDALRARGDTAEPGSVLLDIGGGIGAIHHALLEGDIDRAVQVDASPGYLAVSREETTRRGHGERVTFLAGDFVALADQVPDADVVTLDRVICCYHDMERLVARSAARARQLYGAVYPREGWWMRLGVRAVNVVLRLRRTAFRTYFHPPARIDAALRDAGLRRRSVRRTFAWEVAVYERV